MLERPSIVVVVMVAAIGISALLFRVLPAELAPLEDRGMVDVTVTGPDGAGFEWTSAKMREVEKPLLKLVEEGEAARVNIRMPTGRGNTVTQLFNTGRAIALLAPYDKRTLSSQQVLERLRRETKDITGVRVLPGLRQGLSRNSGQPLQFVLQGSNYDELAQWRNLLMQRLERNPQIYALDSDYRETQAAAPGADRSHARRRPRRVHLRRSGTRSRPISAAAAPRRSRWTARSTT
jgi:multidrug efflux pump